MVAPITGPFVKTEWLNMPPPNQVFRVWYRKATWRRQKSPIDRPLPYNLNVGKVLYANGGPPWFGADYVDLYNADNANTITHATQKALSKLQDACGAQAQLAANLAEYRQAADMMTARASQLVRFVRALRRLDFHTAASYLTVSPNHSHADLSREMRKRWKRDKDLSGAFLEAHFGWSPLVGDIYGAMEAISNPVQPKPIRVRASDYHERRWKDVQNDLHYFVRDDVRVELRCELKVHNPNLGLLTQLGLDNPLSVAWEVVPFSFVADWFTNAGQYIGALAGNYGTDFVNASSTVCLTTMRQKRSPSIAWTTASQGFTLNRTIGLPEVEFYFRPIHKISWTRAVTAMSLLVQLIPKLPRTPANRFGLY